MTVKIQPGNSKLGSLPNVSLPPGVTCNPAVPCFKDGCYARKFSILRLTCRSAWAHNLQEYKWSPRGYFGDIQNYLEKNRPSMWRWHVSGDVPDEAYFAMMEATARKFPDIKFLAFTKRYDVLPFDRLVTAPHNLRVVISRWPGDNVPSVFWGLPQAWLTEDERAPLSAFPCPGLCDRCGMCWKLGPGESVAFDKH